MNVLQEICPAPNIQCVFDLVQRRPANVGTEMAIEPCKLDGCTVKIGNGQPDVNISSTPSCEMKNLAVLTRKRKEEKRGKVTYKTVQHAQNIMKRHNAHTLIFPHFTARSIAVVRIWLAIDTLI